VSYRHSSYRKLSRIVGKTIDVAPAEAPKLPRHEMDRVLHWSNRPALPKPYAWGRAEGWRG
jgi:hypothetical protein